MEYEVDLNAYEMNQVNLYAVQGEADSRKIISENIVADRSKLKIICVFLHRIYFGRIPYER